MHGKLMLYVDQYGNKFYAHTVTELRNEVGGGRVSKMYIDKLDGRSVHVGYVIGNHWLRAFEPVERVA